MKFKVSKRQGVTLVAKKGDGVMRLLLRGEKWVGTRSEAISMQVVRSIKIGNKVVSRNALEDEAALDSVLRRKRFALARPLEIYLYVNASARVYRPVVPLEYEGRPDIAFEKVIMPMIPDDILRYGGGLRVSTDGRLVGLTFSGSDDFFYLTTSWALYGSDWEEFRDLLNTCLG